MTFLPAPANSGIRFRRVDLDGKPEVEARVRATTDLARLRAALRQVLHVAAPDELTL